MPVESRIPIIPSANLEKSLRLWVDGLGFSMSSEMRKDEKLIFCMLRKDDLCFMLNRHAGTPVKPEDYEGIRLRWAPQETQDQRAIEEPWIRVSDLDIETTDRLSFSLPTTTAIRIASASLHNTEAWRIPWARSSCGAFRQCQRARRSSAKRQNQHECEHARERGLGKRQAKSCSHEPDAKVQSASHTSAPHSNAPHPNGAKPPQSHPSHPPEPQSHPGGGHTGGKLGR